MLEKVPPSPAVSNPRDSVRRDVMTIQPKVDNNNPTDNGKCC